MQFSSLIAGRTIVLLACLILLPLAAVLGPALPKSLRSTLKSAFGTSTGDAPGTQQDKRVAAKPQNAGPAGDNNPKHVVRQEVAADDRVSLANQTEAAAGTGDSALATGGDSLQELFGELKGLDVSEFRLEPWGKSAELYRFQCQASIDGSERHSRHFEATASDPIRAVREVVERVGTWRTAQGTSRHGANRRRLHPQGGGGRVVR